jgi:hypothetical protein
MLNLQQINITNCVFESLYCTPTKKDYPEDDGKRRVGGLFFRNVTNLFDMLFGIFYFYIDFVLL